MLIPTKKKNGNVTEASWKCVKWVLPFSPTDQNAFVATCKLYVYQHSGQLSLLLNNYVLVNSSRLFNLFFQFVIFVPLSSPVINFKASGKKRMCCMFSGLWFNFSFFLYPNFEGRILHMLFGSWDPFEGQDERPCTDKPPYLFSFYYLTNQLVFNFIISLSLILRNWLFVNHECYMIK